METERSWENDDGFITIVKTEPEDFLSVEYSEPNEQSEPINFGNYDDPPDLSSQYGNPSMSGEFNFKQEGIDTGEDMDYRMESYQGEQIYPHDYPQEAANNMGEWQYTNGFIPSETVQGFLDQPGTSDMSMFAEKREEKLYPCRYCEYVGTHPRLLSSHMNNRHTKSVVYQCPHCPYNSTISRSTKDHVETKHENEDDKPIEIKKKCEFCDYSASNATALKNHMNKHTKEKKHQCSFCDFNTLWEGYLKMHIRRKHGDQTIEFGNSMKEYPCQYCDYKALTPSSLKLHTNKHTREQEHQCPHCPYKTVWTTYIKLHIKNKHFKTEKSPFSKEHACSYCEYKAKNTTLLKQHMNKHTREKINQCPHCPFTTLWITYMKLHIKRKHSVKTEGEATTEKRDFQCHYCSYKAISSSHLKIHENKHTKAVEYKCGECDFKTTWFGYLKLHTKRKHTIKVKEENPSTKTTYPCKFCSYKAINLSTLKVHQNKHTREVLYNCPHCDFKTTWRAYIKMHIEKHNVENFKSRKQKYEGIKSFPCQYCDYNATQLGSLKLHVNSKHTRKILHKCPKCDYQCAVYGNLKMHIRRKHGLKPEADGKYHCKECEFSSENSSELKIHLNEKHDVKIEIDEIKKDNDKIYTCQHCSYQTLYPQVMEKHINKHTRQNVFKCPHCPYSTVWNHYMKVHIRRHSEPKTGRQRFTRPNTDQNRMFPCQYCDHRSISSSSLRDHVNSVHTREVFFKCPYCEHKCTLKGNLRGHIRRKHPAQFVESEKRYSCNHCDFKASLMRNLKIHQKNEHNIDFLQVKTENGEFPCQHCEYKARSYYALKIHTNKHTKENSYSCPECEFETRWPNYLSKHIQQHSLNKRKVTCLYCDYKGCSTFRLRKHIETLHKLDKHYPCPKPKCEFKTIHYTSLRIHLKGNIHADGRRKSNMSVTRNFSYKYEPNEGRYFACDYCDYASKTQGNLDLHVKNKHEKKSLMKCGLCDYKTPSKSYLNRHFKVKHSVKMEGGIFTVETKTDIDIVKQEENFMKEEPNHFVTEMAENEIKDSIETDVEQRRCKRQRNSIPSYLEEETEEDEISSDTNDFKEVFEKSLQNQTNNIEEFVKIENGLNNEKAVENVQNIASEKINAGVEANQNEEGKDDNTRHQIRDTISIEDLPSSYLYNVQHLGIGTNTTQMYPKRRARIKLTPRRICQRKMEQCENKDRLLQNTKSSTTEIIEMEDYSHVTVKNEENNKEIKYRTDSSIIHEEIIQKEMRKVSEQTNDKKSVSTPGSHMKMSDNDNKSTIDHVAVEPQKSIEKLLGTDRIALQYLDENNTSKEQKPSFGDSDIIEMSFSDSAYVIPKMLAGNNEAKFLNQERMVPSNKLEENLVSENVVEQKLESCEAKDLQRILKSESATKQDTKIHTVSSEYCEKSTQNLSHTDRDVILSPGVNDTSKEIKLRCVDTEMLIGETVQTSFCDPAYKKSLIFDETNQVNVLSRDKTELADKSEENLASISFIEKSPESCKEKDLQKIDIVSSECIEKSSQKLSNTDPDIIQNPGEDNGLSDRKLRCGNTEMLDGQTIQMSLHDPACAKSLILTESINVNILHQEETGVTDKSEGNLTSKNLVEQNPESYKETDLQQIVMSNVEAEEGTKIDIGSNEYIDETNGKVQNISKQVVIAEVESSCIKDETNFSNRVFGETGTTEITLEHM